MAAAATPGRLDPARLVEHMAPMSLRAVARRIGVDPAVLCRPLSEGQADRYCARLAVHPGEVWGADWYRPGKPAAVGLGEERAEREAVPALASTAFPRVPRSSWMANGDYDEGPALPTASDRRSIRESAGLSKLQMAEMLGVSRTSVLNWEQGGNPRLDARRDYAEMLEAIAAGHRPQPPPGRVRRRRITAEQQAAIGAILSFLRSRAQQSGDETVDLGNRDEPVVADADEPQVALLDQIDDHRSADAQHEGGSLH